MWGAMSLSKIIRHQYVIFLGILILSLQLSACAFAPVERPVIQKGQGVQQRVIDLPREQAFKMAGYALESMGYPVGSQDRQQWLIKSKPAIITIHGNADCGTWNGNPLKGNTSTILVIKVDEYVAGQSLVSIAGVFAVHFKGHNKLGMVTREETYRCASLGLLESDYMRVLTRLAAEKSPDKGKKAEQEAKEAEASPKAPAQEAPRTAVGSSTQNASPPATPAAPVEDPKLQKLKALKSMGLLSDQEFEVEKAKLNQGGR